MSSLLQLICCGILTIVISDNNVYSKLQDKQDNLQIININENQVIMNFSEATELISSFLNNTELTIIAHNYFNETLKVYYQSPSGTSRSYNAKKILENIETKDNNIKNILLQNNINIAPNKHIHDVFEELYKVHFRNANNINKINLILDCTKNINNLFKEDIKITLNNIDSIIEKDKINKLANDVQSINSIFYRLQENKQYIQGIYDVVDNLFCYDTQIMQWKEKVKDIFNIALDYLETEQKCLHALGYEI